MAEGNGELLDDINQKADDRGDGERTEDYPKLLEYGLDKKGRWANLDEIYKTGKTPLTPSWMSALWNALKEFPGRRCLECAGSGSSNRTWEHVKGPDEDKIKKILERTGYTLDVTTGQRKYGGPPPDWEGNVPGNGCEVFCGKIPKDMYEDELIPLFENCGTIWDLRLMMDPMTGTNRGYAFVTFTNRDAAVNAVRQLNSL
ncbi:GL27352 [Drosophila persimilis]|uniref:GL27352 n=1 Tax=Drosophila persimilis TaxID=7234 RepID=B4GZF2_DROPE|nr:GL27352 [Drosophila persimilis]